MIAASAGAGKKLRIGLLIDSDAQPAWACQILEDLGRSAFAEIVLVVEGGAAPRRRGLRARLRGLRGAGLLYGAYARLDRHLAGRGVEALAVRHLRGLLPRCPRLSLQPPKGPGAGELRDEDLRRLAASDLDVLLRLGPAPLRGGLLSVARHGVCEIRPGPGDGGAPGAPVGVVEVLRGQGTTTCALQVLRADGARVSARVMDRAVLRTLPGSARRNQGNALSAAATMVPRRLEELWRRGALEALPPGDALQPPGPLPGGAALARDLLGLAVREARRRLRRLRVVQERHLAYHLGPAGDLGAPPLDRFRDLAPPPGAFWADPFALHRDGRHYVFFEEFVYAQHKGRISVVAVDEAGPCGPAQVALEQPQHLSYPFLFARSEALHLLPETHRRRTVELYRCRRFPGDWALDAVLLSGVEAVDATLHEEGGRFYLFFATRAPGAVDFDELHVHCAERLAGPSRPVGNSPIKRDVRSSRPAGALFRMGGTLYRPAQVGAPTYGRAVVLCEVLHLGPDRYEERPGRTIEPTWRPGLVGTHTLHHAGGLTVVDVFYEIGRLDRLRARLRSRAAARRARAEKIPAPAGAPRGIFAPCEAPPSASVSPPR